MMVLIGRGGGEIGRREGRGRAVRAGPAGVALAGQSVYKPGAKCSLGGPAPPAAPSGCAQPEQSPARQSTARAIKGEPESMAIERTFSIIKPDATRRKITGKITDRLEQCALRVLGRDRKHQR